MSGAEIMILLVVGIVVVGPKKLPGMMRTAGRWIAKVRRMTMDVRENTGIDKIIREEGLEKEIREFQSLARSPMLRGLSGLSPSSMVSRALTETAVGSGSSAAFATRAQTTASPSIASSKGSVPSASSSSASSSSTPSLVTPAASSSAAALIKPAEGNIPRGADQALAMLHASGFFSFREREYPTIGCDAYDALPDDLDDPDAYPFEDPEGEAEASSDAGSAEANAALQPDSAQPESAQSQSAEPESAQPEVLAASADATKLESEVAKIEAEPIPEEKLEASQ